MTASEMTPDQIRVRCAEIDGKLPICTTCRKPEVEAEISRLGNWGPPLMCCAFGQKRELNLPNYPESIDAINAAVLRLSSEKRQQWVRQLRTSLYDFDYDYSDCEENLAVIATASALDRAKVYVAIHES